MPDAELRPLAPIESLPGIGPRTAPAFRRLGIETAADLVRHLPMRYEEERSEETIESLTVACKGGATGVASVRVEVAAVRSIPGRASRVEATLEDESGRLRAVWFNAPWMRQRIHPGQKGLVQGAPKLRGAYLEMTNPTWAPFDPADPPAARRERLRPIYPASEELSSGQVERAVAAVLPGLLPLMDDPLPPEYRATRGLVPLAEAYERMHAPRSRDEQLEARRRLAFEELLILQLGVTMKRRQIRDGIRAPVLPLSPAIDARIRARIPFTLTDEQNRVVAEIAADMGQPSPMNRLLQGDVGSGKTAVALYGMLLAVAHGRQAALVAPTEILAEQHYEGIARHLVGSDVRVELLTGSIVASERRAALERLREGESALAIGTHALLLEDARFRRLALAVIDEQHRFGVEQRARVREKVAHDTGEAPHVLVMTATPIPRTLSLTVFGDLDTSVLRGSPPGRQPVVTRVVPSTKSSEVYAYLRTRIEQGEQCYVVVPAVEESSLGLKDAEGHAAALQDGPFEGLRVGVVHGQMHRDDREEAMRLFREGVTQVLVATVVIEVGVDVPNASLMVVEHAERFGLAQLHQLRGRVGRGARRSLCVFIGDPTTEEASRRLEAIGSTADGFAIAEADLAIRGPGELFGSRQSGLPPFRVADLAHDSALLAMARRDAQEWIERDPQLAAPEHVRVRRKLMSLYGQALGLSVVA
jgi:ATP-dependent DNA helicase RecG